MRRLAMVLTALTLFDATMLMAWPHRYLRFWRDLKWMPKGARGQFDAYAGLPAPSLRWLGLGWVLTATPILLGLSRASAGVLSSSGCEDVVVLEVTEAVCEEVGAV